MKRNLRSIGIALSVGLIAFAGSTAHAGWMGFRNDTKEPIVILETVVVNGQQRPGRPQRLGPGEAIRDTQCAGASRSINIFDPKKPNVPIYTGNFPCPAANENLLYLIQASRNGIVIEPVKSPAQSPKK